MLIRGNSSLCTNNQCLESVTRGGNLAGCPLFPDKLMRMMAGGVYDRASRGTVICLDGQNDQMCNI